MQAKNCPRCGRIFMQKREYICDFCVKAEEEIFEKVREYVRENPNRTIGEVSEVCEVSIKRILQYIRDGRLEASTGMDGEVTCSKCGKSIIIGRMCETCIIDTNFEINEMKNQYKIKNTGRVFTRRGQSWPE